MSGTAGDRLPAAEATAAEYQAAGCLHCGGPVLAPKRKGLVKKFCRDRCRAAYRDAVIARSIAAAESVVVEAQAAMGELRDELDRQGARLAGALALLRRSGPRPAQSDAESEPKGQKGLASGSGLS